MKKIDITPQELCERLFKGESFYDGKGDRLFWDGSRFREEIRDGAITNGTSMNSWLAIDIYTKPQWTDNLSEENPVYCWVWDSERDEAVKSDVCSVSDSRYETEDCYWHNAEPVKLEDACIWRG